MEMLQLALKARIPFIHVKTDDVLYVQKILTFLAGEQVVPFKVQGDDFSKAELPSGNIFFTVVDQFPQQLYVKLKAEKKTLVYVNTKTSVLHLITGTMLPPKEMIRAEIIDILGITNAEEAKMVDELLPAFGGTTLKDTYEIIRLAQKKLDGAKLTTKAINKIRQSYVAKLKGINQVETEYLFYQVPSYLQTWVDQNLDFFRFPVHESLTPRGLLFDGPPGTGKTMGAKFIANALGVPLYHLDIGGMKGKYVGDSESNLNAALTQIDQAAPCVVILDEVEKIFGGATEQHGDSGVTSSLLGTLLWWLQEHKSRVFTIMTTNKKDILPKELYRERRIDASMTFQGLETVDQAFEFAREVANHMQKSLGGFTSEEVLSIKTSLKSKLDVMFTDGNAVPQVKVTQMVHDALKTALNARKAQAS